MIYSGVAASHFERLRIWNLGDKASHLLTWDFKNPVVDMVISPENSIIAVDSLDGFVHFSEVIPRNQFVAYSNHI